MVNLILFVVLMVKRIKESDLAGPDEIKIRIIDYLLVLQFVTTLIYFLLVQELEGQKGHFIIGYYIMLGIVSVIYFLIVMLFFVGFTK